MHRDFLSDIERHLYSNPEGIAYRCGDESLTRGELLTKAFGLAHLLAKDVGPVILFGHKQQEMVIGMLACLFAGRPYVPCDSILPISRVALIKGAVSASLLIAAEPIAIDGVDVLEKSDIANVVPRQQPPGLWFDAKRPAYIMFTSGSTGEPKGVPISCGNLANFIGWMREIPAIRECGDIVLNQAPFSFDLSVADFYLSMVEGKTLCALTAEDASDHVLLYGALENAAASLIVCTPTFMRLLLAGRAFSKEMAPNLRCVFFCGEVLPIDTVKNLYSRFPGIRIVNAYGPTEATCAVTAVEIAGEMLEGQALPIGDLRHSAVSITIDSNDVSSPEGNGIGEIVLEGKSVFRGYLREEGSVGRYHTGDGGYICDGLLYFSERQDAQVKFKGYCIHPAEIERALCEIEEIEAAVAIPQRRNWEVVRLAAFVAGGSLTDPDSVKRRLSEMLPSYMVPSVVRIVDKLPVNQNGKIDRKALWREVNGGV